MIPLSKEAVLFIVEHHLNRKARLVLPLKNRRIEVSVI